MYAYSIGSELSVNVNVEVFSNIELALYCSDCEQAECFFCSMVHEDRQYTPHNLIQLSNNDTKSLLQYEYYLLLLLIPMNGGMCPVMEPPLWL